MLLAVMALPCAPMVLVHYPHVYCYLCICHLYNVQMLLSHQNISTCNRATLTRTASFLILLKQHLVPLEPFSQSRPSSLVSFILILSYCFHYHQVDCWVLVSCQASEAQVPQINLNRILSISYSISFVLAHPKRTSMLKLQPPCLLSSSNYCASCLY